MSTVRARETFHHEGGTELGGTQRPDDDPLVLQFPMFYEPFDRFEEPRRRGRPAGTRARSKPDGTADG